MVKGDALYLGSSGRFRQAGPVTGRADFFLQEFFDALHALFVFNLREGIFNGIDSVVVGEVEFTGFIGIFRFIKDMLFHRRSMVDDIFFFLRQVFKGHVGADSHSPADVGHEGPHEAVPGSDGAVVDGERLIGDEGGHVNGADHACAAAVGAGALGIKGQFLCRRRRNMGAALGADEVFFRGHV